MVRYLKLISIIMILSFVFTLTAFAAQDNQKYFEYDQNDEFMVKYYKETKNVKNAEELKEKLRAMGFEQNKETKVIFYYEAKGDNIKYTGKKKVIEDNGQVKYYINEKMVSEDLFNFGSKTTDNFSTLDTYESSELTLTLTEYRGKEIDQYVTDRLNLIYEFDWDGTKLFTDMFGAYWDDTDAYKTGVSASSGLTYFATDNVSRLFEVNKSTKSGYISVMLKSRDGYVYDDHGSATSDYEHVEVAAANWSFSGGVDIKIFNINLSYDPDSKVERNVADFTF